MKIYDCCHNCEKRHPKCHAECEDKKKADEENELRKQARIKEINLSDYTFKLHHKISKRRNGK